MTKEILLTQGKVTLVDDENFEFLNQWKWYHHQGYACRALHRINHKQPHIFMHRVIINTPLGMETDHINQNRLDNRKENLRACTGTQNAHNKKIDSLNTSGYKGVCWHKYVKKWVAQIGINKTRKHIGYFNTAEDAARAYDELAKIHYGEFANLNFPG